MGEKMGDDVPLSRTAGTTSNTMWPVPRSTSVPSGPSSIQPLGQKKVNLVMLTLLLGFQVIFEAAIFPLIETTEKENN